ncbi:MAG TPA: group 1 glycosyl transferase, partial [Thermoanaerobaculia bacterium]|nr:group 1 glycosyl transferase [Thermoanaerobaculia bacterium]
MKIVYVLESLELSGGVKVIVQHAEGLAARGHEVVLVTKDARHDWIPIRVPVVEVPRFDAETLPPADVHVATWFPTVAPTV